MKRVGSGSKREKIRDRRDLPKEEVIKKSGFYRKVLPASPQFGRGVTLRQIYSGKGAKYRQNYCQIFECEKTKIKAKVLQNSESKEREDRDTATPQRGESEKLVNPTIELNTFKEEAEKVILSYFKTNQSPSILVWLMERILPQK